MPFPVNNEVVSAKALGQWLDVTDRMVREYADKGIVIRSGRGKYLLQESVTNLVKHLREVSAGRGGETQILDLTAERARLAKEQADAQALKNAQLRGELVHSDAVQAEWTDMIRLMRSNMLAVPARCRQRNNGFGPAETDLIRREITEALEAIANDRDHASAIAGDGDASAEKEAVGLD